MSDISEQVLFAAKAISKVPETELCETVQAVLRQFISSDFAIGSGALFDTTGKSTSVFPIVISRTIRGRASSPERRIAADEAAVVIELYEELNAERLREAYSKIAEVRKLSRAPVPRGENRSNITLGVVFARRCSGSLDALADQLFQLNSETPHQHWLDMIVVDAVGVISYAVQFPGEGLAGDFLPPAEGALAPPAPPAFYVTIVLRPTMAHSFNKLLAFIIGHLQIFSPEVRDKQANWSLILDGQPTGAITTMGFQPNLQGQIVAVPAEGYSGKFIPNRPIVLEDPSGEILGAIQFMKWQTGGVIILTGKLPLEGMLIFLANLKPEYLRVMKRPSHQISPVLPISEIEFKVFLSNILRRSNLRIREDTGSIIMQKFLDEGTATPFIARCTLGLLRIRENVLTDISKREDFDKRFQSSLSSLMTARKARKDLSEIWTRHEERVSSGEVARLEGRDIRVRENVNKPLSEEFETFLNAATRLNKTGVQGLCAFLGVDIGFLFRKKSAFDVGIERLRKIDVPLASYLVEARKWTERLVLLRNDLEHEIWDFPRVAYSAEGGGVRASEPQIAGETVTDLVDFLLDRTLCFFEEVLAHALQRRLPDGTTLTEVAHEMRAKEAPERFRITLAQGGNVPWQITYHVSQFDDA